MICIYVFIYIIYICVYVSRIFNYQESSRSLKKYHYLQSGVAWRQAWPSYNLYRQSAGQLHHGVLLLHGVMVTYTPAVP